LRPQVGAGAELRDTPLPNKTLARRLDELEVGTDAKFKVVFEAIRQLMAPPEPKPKRSIGFVQDQEKKRS
jgi:hypothetical protein